MSKNKKRRPANRAGLLLGRVVCFYPVYATEDVLGQRPLYEVDRETRDLWLADGAAVSMSRGKAIRLLLNLPPEIQTSQAMGGDVSDGVLDGKPYARACLAAWGARDRNDGVTA